MRKVPKKGTLAWHKKKAWDAFSLLKKFEHSQDGETVKCYTCGKEMEIGTSDCQGGHCLRKKGYPALYFHENNVRAQCYACNHYKDGNEAVFVSELIREIGQEAYYEMYSQRHNQVKITKKEYEEMELQWKTRLLELKKERGW